MDFAPHDDKDLRQCDASELFLGAVFWIKQDNGEFHKAIVPEAEEWKWYGEKSKAEFRNTIKKFSQENKLWTRRDKAFKHFWQ